MHKNYATAICKTGHCKNVVGGKGRIPARSYLGVSALTWIT
jgi:hypothetical protein